MKKLIPFIILYWSFLMLCPGTKAQWEGAQVHRLTYDDLPNETIGLHIDDTDNLHLFYLEGVRDTITGFVYDYRIFYITKEKNAGWSQRVEVQTPDYIFGQNRKGKLRMDTKTGVIHTLSTNYAWNNLYYTNSTVPGWEFSQIDSLPGGQNAQYNSFDMDFDGWGNVHLAWHVDFDSIGSGFYRVMYADNSTGEWAKQQVGSPIFLGGMESGATHFDVQKNGTVHIVYYGHIGSGLSHYARNDSLNSNDWQIDTLPRPPRPLYYYGVGTIKVDVNDRVHLITGGCIEEDCVGGSGLQRHFYYVKESEDSIWQGPELILDSLFYFTTIFINSESVPYLMEWNPYTYCRFFTDREQGFWRLPYQIFDTTSMCNALSSTYRQGLSFVLDSEGQGHAVFAGCLRQFMGQDDSLEIYYYGPPLTSVEYTSEEQRKFSFELFQNYPNPFNSVTSIQYTVTSRQSLPTHTTLKIYNILGKEVRELVNTKHSSGNYIVTWDGKDNSAKEVASGIYFYQLRARDYKQTKKLILMK